MHLYVDELSSRWLRIYQQWDRRSVSQLRDLMQLRGVDAATIELIAKRIKDYFSELVKATDTHRRGC